MFTRYYAFLWAFLLEETEWNRIQNFTAFLSGLPFYHNKGNLSKPEWRFSSLGGYPLSIVGKASLIHMHKVTLLQIGIPPWESHSELANKYDFTIIIISYVHCVSCPLSHWPWRSDLEQVLWPIGVVWVKISKSSWCCYLWNISSDLEHSNAYWPRLTSVTLLHCYTVTLYSRV